MNATQLVPASTLKVGDICLGSDGFDLKVTAIVPVGKKTADITTEYVEAAMMPSRPGPATQRVRLSNKVRKYVTF